jgi:hypothetical protein
MALLYVTVEGFLELKIDNPEIGSLLSEQHPVDLKLFRNSVFHPQKNFDKRERMHEMEKLNWATAVRLTEDREFVVASLLRSRSQWM